MYVSGKGCDLILLAMGSWGQIRQFLTIFCASVPSLT
jgi:hypothetical protein